MRKCNVNDDYIGQEDQAEQTFASVVPPEDRHQDSLQQVPPPLAPRKDRLLSQRRAGQGSESIDARRPTSGGKSSALQLSTMATTSSVGTGAAARLASEYTNTAAERATPWGADVGKSGRGGAAMLG
eukprot:Skav225529  [mRNA]  locus=scaffold144:415365:422336:- [translate_table: standard]